MSSSVLILGEVGGGGGGGAPIFWYTGSPGWVGDGGGGGGGGGLCVCVCVCCSKHS